VVHLAHEEKVGIIECPVCVLARSGKFGQRRSRPGIDKPDAPVLRGDYRAWPQATAWPGRA
jgi:hypothetical protein